MLTNCGKHLRSTWLVPVRLARTQVQSTPDVSESKSSDVAVGEEEEFRKLQLIPKKEERKQFKKMTVDRARAEILPPRWTRMPINQDWLSVWPVAHSFKQSAVPLPVRMGFEKKMPKKAPPGKYANLELMKIPNFLHLTPSAIKRHCAAIKGFCTEWPPELAEDSVCEQLFPLKFTMSDYVHAGPSLRDPRSRIVILKVKLSSLNLDYHARDKLLRLVGSRYDKNTDLLTLVTDRCPARHQNKEYAMYLLTALVFEAQKMESWEGEKTEFDMEKYFWDGSKAQKAVLFLVENLKSSYDELLQSEDSDRKRKIDSLPSYLSTVSSGAPTEEKLNIPEVIEYSKAWDRYRNNIESEENLTAYGQAVQKLLGIPNLPEV